MINTKAHALIDYVLGIILIASPWLFGHEPAGTSYVICIATASLIILMAVFTKFEYSALRWLPLRLHLIIDVASGALLASSPWLLDFSHEVFKPHLVFGLTLVAVALLTDRMLYRRVKVMQLRSGLKRVKENHEHPVSHE